MQQVEHWIVPKEKSIKVSNLEGIGQTSVPLHGFDPKQVREWNEEFQVVRSFNSDTYLMRI